MNVSFKANEDAVSGEIKVEIVKADYADGVKKSLQSVRQKANMPGFRRGMVPMGLIQKLYGKQAIADECNKLVSEGVTKCITDNKLAILGQPIPSETEHKPVDFDTDEEFEFVFDVALSPQVNVSLTKDDVVTYYKIQVEDEDVERQIEAYRNNYGTFEKPDTAEATDMLKGKLTELDASGEPLENGTIIDDNVLSPQYIKVKTEQKKFVGAKTGDTVVFNPYKAFKGAEAELASLLRLDKEKVKDAKSDYSFEIKEITRHIKAELNQEFYDKLYGEGKVTDEATMREKVRQSIEYQYKRESDYRFGKDLHNLLLAKAGDIRFADDILKRFMTLRDEKHDAAETEKSYPQLVEALKYQTVRDALAVQYNIEVNDEDIKQVATQSIITQFAQYGYYNPDEETVKKYVEEQLSKRENIDRFAEIVIEEKLTPILRETLTVDEKTVTLDDFYGKSEEAAKAEATPEAPATSEASEASEAAENKDETTENKE